MYRIMKQNDLAAAGPGFQRALAIRETALGPTIRSPHKASPT
jgi:hypothetical protein